MDGSVVMKSCVCSRSSVVFLLGNVRRSVNGASGKKMYGMVLLS